MIEYDSLVNRTVRRIKPSGIRKFFDIANEMDDVISLSVGEPDFHTPGTSGRRASRAWRRAAPATPQTGASSSFGRKFPTLSSATTT